MVAVEEGAIVLARAGNGGAFSMASFKVEEAMTAAVGAE